jgi:hypothetical protein
MAEPAEMEKRIRVLEEIEAIKKLKAKYFRCVDKKLWDEMEELWVEDAVADYGMKGDYGLPEKKTWGWTL